MKKGALPKFTTLLFLYLAQSIPMSFFTTIVPVIMRQENYSLESIGLLQLIKLPWIFKFLWAPMVDMQGSSLSHYRRWILMSELVYAVIIIAVGFLDLQANFVNIIILMVIAVVASGTQDIATDAYAILTLKYSERGFGNSMQSAGGFLGTLIGSGILLIVYHNYGWQGVLWGMAAFVLLAIIPLLLYQPKMGKHLMKKRENKKVKFTDSFTFFRRAKIYKRVILLLTFQSGIIGILAMQKPFLVDLGYSVQQIGLLAGIYGTAVGTICSLIGGYLIKRIGRKPSLIAFAIFGVVVSVFYYLISLGTVELYQLYIGIGLLWAAYGMSLVAIFTISMDIVRPGREGTDFTVQIVVTHVSSLIIAVLSGKFADTYGYSGLFLTQAFMAVIVVVITYLSYNQKEITCADN